MPSVADDLRARSLTAAAALGPLARLQRALVLGDADVRILAAARGLSESDARRLLARGRATGRQPSVANTQP